MQNEFSSANDEAAKFTTKDDEQSRMRDSAAVNLARQIHEWSKDNLARYDNDGNKRVNFGELDLGARTSSSTDDAAALHFLQDHYKEIQGHSQNKFLFFKGAGGLSVDGIGEYAEELEKQREEHEQQLNAAIHERALQAGSRDLVNKLMSTPDGNPNNSLFRVIDSLDGDIDNAISKKDLNRYLDEYQKRARYGDIGSGFFTPETRRYVEHLRDRWDSPESVRVRGTWTRHDHDNRDEQVPNSKISEENLAKAIGVPKNGDVFAPFVKAAPVEKAAVEVKPLEAPAAAAKSAPIAEKAGSEAVAKTQKPEQAAAPKPIESKGAAPTAPEHKLAQHADKPVVHATQAPKHDANCDKETQAKPHTAAAAAAAHKAKLAQARHDAPAAPAQAKVETAPKAVGEAKPAPAEAPAKVVAAPDAPQAKAETVPAVMEAPESARVKFSPWKAEPATVMNYVQSKISANYYSGEKDIAKINAAAAIRDNEALAKAVNLNEWGKDNLRCFDTSGDNRLNYGELDLGIRTSKDMDRTMLSDIQQDFDKFKAQTGNPFLGKHPDAVSQKDLQVNVEKRQEEADANEKARQAAADERAERFRDSQLMSGLLSNPDGNPNHSLFRVIDGLDNDIDNEISRRDLHKYMDEYQKRARYGDVGHGYFSSSMRQYVEYMDNNWDSAEIKHLRGTYRDSDNREQTNSKISLEHLRQMVGLSTNDALFQQFSAEQ